MNQQISTIFNKKEEISSNADQFYKDYWTKGINISEQTKVKNKIISSNFFPYGISGKRILEIGVGGEGGLIYPLKENNNVFGVDVSDSAILNCRQMGLEVKKINLDIESLPFDNSYFDIILAFEVFEHFSNPQHAIEEIKRVLKIGGLVIISIPTPFTYHWPRLFYPSLFEFQDFKEFLMINEFDVAFKKLKIYNNLHFNKNIGENKKMWSWFWECNKINPKDTMTLLKIAQYFWQKKDENNLRISPVEAIEMFRKCYKNDINNIKIKLLFLTALIYRVSLGDYEEFNGIITSLNKDMNNPLFYNNPEYLYELLLFDLEAKSLSQKGFDKKFIEYIANILSNLSGGSNYLENISIEKRKLGIII